MLRVYIEVCMNWEKTMSDIDQIDQQHNFSKIFFWSIKLVFFFIIGFVINFRESVRILNFRHPKHCLKDCTYYPHFVLDALDKCFRERETHKKTRKKYKKLQTHFPTRPYRRRCCPPIDVAAAANSTTIHLLANTHPPIAAKTCGMLFIECAIVGGRARSVFTFALRLIGIGWLVENLFNVWSHSNDDGSGKRRWIVLSGMAGAAAVVELLILAVNRSLWALRLANNWTGSY